MKKATNQKTKTKTKTVVIVSFFLLFFVLLLRLIFPKHTGDSTINVYPTSQEIDMTNNRQDIRLYTSQLLKFSIDVSPKYRVSEMGNSVYLRDNEKEIMVSKNNTNFLTIDEYVRELEKRNKVKINSSYDAKIDGNPVLVGYIAHLLSNLPTEKAYFIMPKKYTIFLISTSSPELYGDLDQIARSFRYLRTSP